MSGESGPTALLLPTVVSFGCRHPLLQKRTILCLEIRQFQIGRDPTCTNYKRGIHLASTAGILSQLRNNTRRWRSNRLKLVKFGWVYYRSAIAERVRLRRWLLAFGLRDQVETHSAIPRAVVKQSSISFFGNHVRLKNIEKGIELALKFVSKIHRSNSR